MSDPYVSLKASADAARAILEASADSLPSFASWPDVIRSYRRAKQPLIDALDSATGRRVIPFTHEMANVNALSAWRDSLRFTAANVAHESGTEKGRDRYALICRYSTAADTFALAMRTQDASGAVSADSPLCSLPSVRRSQRLTRALGAYLRSQGATEQEASVLAEAYSSAAQVKPQQGHIVISANVLDILTCSEHCTYSSCHGFDGCHRSGPLCYLSDPHTLTVFYYEETAPWHGFTMPRKTFRQMVYVDAKRRSAALQRRYGANLPHGLHKTVRREVARLLTVLATGAPCEGEPR